MQSSQETDPAYRYLYNPGPVLQLLGPIQAGLYWLTVYRHAICKSAGRLAGSSLYARHPNLMMILELRVTQGINPYEPPIIWFAAQ